MDAPHNKFELRDRKLEDEVDGYNQETDRYQRENAMLEYYLSKHRCAHYDLCSAPTNLHCSGAPIQPKCQRMIKRFVGTITCLAARLSLA